MDKHDLTEQLHFLIRCLETEMPEYAGYALPDDLKQAFNLYRALCNVRMPSGDTGHTLPGDFYTVQSEVLKSITEEKGITEATALPPAKLDHAGRHHDAEGRCDCKRCQFPDSRLLLSASWLY